VQRNQCSDFNTITEAAAVKVDVTIPEIMVTKNRGRMILNLLFSSSFVFFSNAVVRLTFLDKYISNVEFDLSFLENMDIELLIKKFEQLCSNGYISFMTNDIRKKVIESFKKIINGMVYIHVSFSGIMLNYTSFSSNVRIVRAPPVHYCFN